MKNIAQYFADQLKTGNGQTQEDPEPRKVSKGKRNRVKIKISRGSGKESVCDIIESSNDMIDKTPSPYTKVTNLDKVRHGTPKTSQRNHGSIGSSLEQNDRKRSSSSSGNSKNSSFVNDKIVESIDLLSDEDNSQSSNAFQILMSRGKSSQNSSPVKQSLQNDETSAKKSEEYKQKLKRSKEKLTALADKKGYSKRKLSELEESEKVEQIIQNRIKSLKGEDRKDNSVVPPVLSQRQPSSSLLNYFSKIPGHLTCTTDVSTIVVKADVHVTENSSLHTLYRKNSTDRRPLSKKNRKPNLQFSTIDNIEVIESENISILNDKKKQHEQNKRRWSLRIKLQTYEDEHSLPGGDSSDEEIFSPKSKAKLAAESAKKSTIIKNASSEDTSPKNKNKKKLRKLEGADSIESESENKWKVSSSGKQDKNLSSLANDKFEARATEVDCVIISDNNSKRKTTDKLAPLFTKRQKPDPETIAARKLFLQSDITDNSNKSSDKKTTISSGLPFPVISHVTQLNDANVIQLNNFNIRTKIEHQYVPVFDVTSYKSIMDFSNVKSKSAKNISKPKVQDALTEIEKHCSDARKIWDTVSSTANVQPNKSPSPKTKTKRRSKHAEKKNVESTGKENQVESFIWINKYKPLNTQQVIGNEEAAMKLREWLTGWKAKLTNEGTSSGDEFYSSDSSCTKIAENNQVAVLLGPHGCGKTASVYAVAEELGYTVLEVNASSRRAGKKLLKELEEATKSHRIKKEKNPSNFFSSVSDEIEPKKIPQNSLILIEDVDLVFEEDEGFVSATYQLASNTKRPIAMTCRDVCPHLTRMAPQQNRIYFQSAIGNRVSTLLELISLAETGYKLPHNYIAELLQTGDLRKAILQLQYLLLSGPPVSSGLAVSFRNSLWQKMRLCLYKPIIKANKKRKTKKAGESKTANDNTNVLHDLASKLDNIALISSLVAVEDPALNLCHVKTQPSLSLIENTALYSASNSVSSEISDWITKKILCKDESDDHDATQYQTSTVLKKQLNNGINLALSQATSFLLDNRVMSTDYLPSVRTICRAEESRANTNNKRGNRFFHYLHSLKVPSTSLKPNILAAACRIMHDKADNGTHASENDNFA